MKKGCIGVFAEEGLRGRGTRANRIQRVTILVTIDAYRDDIRLRLAPLAFALDTTPFAIKPQVGNSRNVCLTALPLYGVMKINAVADFFLATSY